MKAKPKTNKPMSKRFEKHANCVLQKSQETLVLGNCEKKRRNFKAKRIAKTMKKGFRKRSNLIKNWRFLRFA